MSHLTERWSALHSVAKIATLGETTFWHVTHDANFKINPDYRAKGAESEMGDPDFRYSTPGLFVTHNPELWRLLWLPMGPAYAAEIECPPGAANRMGTDSDDRDQWFIAKDRLAGCKVIRVVPIDVAIKETRKNGQGFAMIRASDEDSLLHVADHKKGWGAPECLCGAWGVGEPLKWSTKEYVLREMASHPNICPDCVAKLKRQRS